jgi:hypothetical protein
MSLSITKTEYIANCEGAKDAAWGRQLMNEMKIPMEIPRLLTGSEGTGKP